MSPNRKRVAVLIVVVGSALIAEQAISLMSAGAVTEVVGPAERKRAPGRLASVGESNDGAAASTNAAPAASTTAAPAVFTTAAPAAGQTRSAVQLDRLLSRDQALAEDAAPSHPASAKSASQHASAPFDALSWQPPVAKAAVAPLPPPPKPVAPAFPYAYLGGLVDEGVRTAFFTKSERVLPAKVGDTVDAVYRVDQLTDTQMTLTYLPLNEKMTVTIGRGR